MTKRQKKEKLCNQCGKCCYIKSIVSGISFFTDCHCRFLDTKTKLCTIYEKRFEVNPKCLSIKEAIRIKAVPDECPYVKDLKDYHGPIWLKKE